MNYNLRTKPGNSRGASGYISAKVARWLSRLLESGIEMDDDFFYCMLLYVDDPYKFLDGLKIKLTFGDIELFIFRVTRDADDFHAIQ